VLWVAVAIMLAGAGLTLAAPLVVIVGGVAVFTFGFFGAHSIASGWVGRRARAAKAQAASLYLLCYYGGSSVIGWAGGLIYAQGHWPGVVALIAGLLALALVAARQLAGVQPVDTDSQRTSPSSTQPEGGL
jgi:YNFM family putative membrane transporter